MSAPAEAVAPVGVEPGTVILSVEHLVKRFGPLTAIDDVSLTVRAGEVHALLGENGAGKSTLVKMLYGVNRPDGGQILLDGQKVDITSPATARDLGLGMVFQDLRLVPALTVWENVALHAREGGFRLTPRKVQAKLVEESERYGLAVDPTARVSDLSIGEWQRVELLKVLLAGARVLILDEPTSVLTPQEVDGLFAVVRRLRAEGVGIVIITHKMREVREIADRVTVLRGGRCHRHRHPRRRADRRRPRHGHGRRRASPRCTTRTSGAEGDVGTAGAGGPRPPADARRRRVAGSRGSTCTLAPGEILGVAGVAGNGQQELADLLTGTAEGGSGEVTVNGVTLRLSDPKSFHAAGVVPVVADPRAAVRRARPHRRRARGAVARRAPTRSASGSTFKAAAASSPKPATASSCAVAAADRRLVRALRRQHPAGPARARPRRALDGAGRVLPDPRPRRPHHRGHPGAAAGRPRGRHRRAAGVGGPRRAARPVGPHRGAGQGPPRGGRPPGGRRPPATRASS